MDIVNMKGTNFGRVTYLVLDEADRMFEMGFENQVCEVGYYIGYVGVGYYCRRLRTR